MSEDVTIIRDRYNGTYSGAEWLAFNLPLHLVPRAVEAEDSICQWFWQVTDDIVGKGDTPQEAFNSLYQQLEEADEFVHAAEPHHQVSDDD